MKHDELARIEIAPSEFKKIMKDEIRASIYKKLKELGFTWISVDIAGYRSGSLNEALNKKNNRQI